MDIRHICFAMLASILSFLYLYLSFVVISFRRSQRVSLLTNDDQAFIKAVRAHANFSEYVPITLILFALSIYLNIHISIFLLLAVVFVLGRILHAAAFINAKNHKQHFKTRFWGMTATFAVIFASSLYNLIACIIQLAHGSFI